MTTIAVLGTLDTKGAEHAFVADSIRRSGCDCLLIDVGTGGPPTVQPDITREHLWEPNDAPEWTDRGQAIAAMTRQAPVVLRRLADEGKIHGVISLGGSGGTAIAAAVMRALPLGFPKVLVSTVVSGNVSPYVGVSDMVLFPSLVDVSGLNRVSKRVFARAAAAIVAMVRVDETDFIETDVTDTVANASRAAENSDRPVIAASMFGNTTVCVETAKRLLEQAGYEVLVFHATGVGGRTMEGLIESGIIAGVLDVTTTEWADQLVGGVMAAGEHRLEAAARCGVPAVVAPGCLDMVNFGEPASIPDEFEGRRFYEHNPQVTLMRTTPEECERLGQIIAGKLNASTGPVRVLFPTRAISVISAAGQPFHDPDADRRLLESMRQHLGGHVPLVEIDAAINDDAFATAAAETLLGLLGVSDQLRR